MNFFSNPISTEQFHNELQFIQGVSNLVGTHNAENPDNEVHENHLRCYFVEDGYRQVSEERKANVLMCMTEDTVKRYNEALTIIKAVQDHASSIESMGRGLLAAVEGNSQARRDRLWIRSLSAHLEVLTNFRVQINKPNWNFGDLDANLCNLPTRQSVKELRASCKHNGEGLKYETDDVLRKIASAAECIVMAIRELPFAENSKQELLDAANEHAGKATPRIYGDKMTDALVKTMQGLNPKPCVEADLGADWERPVKELAAFDALRACVTLDATYTELVAKWHANLLEWIEKRAQVAQG